MPDLVLSEMALVVVEFALYDVCIQIAIRV